MLSQWEHLRLWNQSPESFATMFFQDGPLFIFLLRQIFSSHYSFSQVTPFGVLGVVLKRTEMFVFGGGTLRTFSSDSSGQLDIFGHDGDSPGVDGTQVGVFE